MIFGYLQKKFLDLYYLKKKRFLCQSKKVSLSYLWRSRFITGRSQRRSTGVAGFSKESQRGQFERLKYLTADASRPDVWPFLSVSLSMRTYSLTQPTAAQPPLGKALRPQSALSPAAQDWPASSLNELCGMKILWCFENYWFDLTEDAIYIWEVWGYLWFRPIYALH